MNELAERLDSEMPLDRVVATCGECEEEFFDTAKEAATQPYMAGAVIVTKAKVHRAEKGHDDLQVAIDKKAPVKEIDCEITVNS